MLIMPRLFAWWCRHRWTAWNEHLKSIDLPIYNVVVGIRMDIKSEARWEERSCTKCGKTERREVNNGLTSTL